jgi:hypothetical protein
MSQCSTILHHLKTDTITSMEAFHQYDITRLAARIADLRESGEKIHTDMITKNKKTFAKYSLE